MPPLPPPNPYIADAALGAERGFFGREDILRDAERTLRRMEKLALVERVGVGQGWQWDKERLLLWQGERWWVATGGFLGWLADVVIGGTRNIPAFEQWLRDQEVLGYLLTRRQWETLRAWSGKVPKSAIGSVGELARQFVAGFFAKRNNRPAIDSS